MKIRMGFVSNSSSSSFCICGIQVGEDLFTDKPEDWEDYEKFFDKKVAKAEKVGLELLMDGECREQGYLGIPLEKMKKTETRGGFELRAKDAIEKFLDKELDEEVEIHYGEISS